MKGDFTRSTFDPGRHFSSVLMQQGRVQLDADWNEQAAIVLYHLRTLARHLIGEHGGPDDGFKIDAPRVLNGAAVPGDFSIGAGHYYVNGILSENQKSVAYTDQPDYPLPDRGGLPAKAQSYVVYLDVWERHITSIEDGHIREVALGGPDTATRAHVVWQVKVLPIASVKLEDVGLDQTKDHLPAEQRVLLQLILAMLVEKTQKDPFKSALEKLDQVSLRARAYVASPSTDPCTISPEARYRGAENQLYRVEVHRSGGAWDGPTSAAAHRATFKWSRENGPVVFPIFRLEGKVVTLQHLGRDNRFGLAAGDWVEVVDDDYVLQNRTEPLLKVQAIDPTNRQVTLDELPASTVGVDQRKHPLLRRWDHKQGDPKQGGLTLYEGAARIVESDTPDAGWLALEDGVQIQFPKPPADDPKSEYRTGDYWLIPARVATGDVEWPADSQGPRAVRPHGVAHYYAPLATISVVPAGVVKVEHRYRRIIKPLWEAEP